MSDLRFNALEESTKRTLKEVILPSVKTSDYFGENVFSRKNMRKYLSKEAFTHVVDAIDKGGRIDRKFADLIASGMKSWAIERGATHYTHWFQPLNGATAEKQEAFYEFSEEGRVFENLNGDLLVQQEPDASSFPNGGIRNTFEARGYTAWDPSSPAFIDGRTLCIPTIFIAYTGEALDYKTPLLRSLAALDDAAVDVCQYFDKKVNKVICTLGWEQEYFLVDEALYNARPDLTLTGRTLMGHSSAKDQQLDDNYFGSIPDRVALYMQDLEVSALKLGIPIKAKHNEVAPNQFEFAPIFEEANLAVDHNQLLMNIMVKIARKHSFRVLFHEKPYKGVNGSGKHNNWSMQTNTGKNLLSLGKTPRTNLQFLTFLVNIIKAFHDNAELMRASIASYGNEHRLGAHEAPPAIMSVFIGAQLSKMLKSIEKRVSSEDMTPDEKTELKLDIGKIPGILLDNTDRNRTSPFAFTGNRFEFRAVGSSDNCSSSLIVLNTAVAKQLKQFKKDVDKKISPKVKKDEAILRVLRKYIVESKDVIFDGNGYGQDWIEEAARRGLPNIANFVDAVKAYVTPQSKKLFADMNVFNSVELEARYEIQLEIFEKKLQIESRILGDMAINHVVPTAIKYQNTLIENVIGLKQIYSEEEYKVVADNQIKTIKTISKNIVEMKDKVTQMILERRKANVVDNMEEKAAIYSKNVKPYLDDIRKNIDILELIVDDKLWPLPKYRELLFIR